jgi:hypothetical protein
MTIYIFNPRTIVINDFLNMYKIKIGQIFSLAHSVRDFAFVNEKPNHYSTIEFLCLSELLLNYISSYTELQHASNNSDHLPVTMSLNLPLIYKSVNLTSQLGRAESPHNFIGNRRMRRRRRQRGGFTGIPFTRNDLSSLDQILRVCSIAHDQYSKFFHIFVSTKLTPEKA